MVRVSVVLILVAALTACGADSTALDPRDDARLALLAAFEQDNSGEPVGGTVVVEGKTVEEVLPSSNLANLEEGRASVLLNDVGTGFVELIVLQGNLFATPCFEFRVDGEAALDGADHPNPDVADGLWEYRCQDSSSGVVSFAADAHVDVRMAFGGEFRERFDWTRFYPLPPKVPDPPNADACKNGGFASFGFANQGQCIRFVATGTDSR